MDAMNAVINAVIDAVINGRHKLMPLMDAINWRH